MQIALSSDNHEVAKWIWQNLVPKSGKAESVQGESLRAIEKLRWEAQENGNINWGEPFIELIEFLQDTFMSEESFTAEIKDSIFADLDRLRNFLPPDEFKNREEAARGPYVEDDLYDRLTDHLIEYCRIHQTVIPLKANGDK